MQIVIIGAGMAGLAAGTRLKRAGHNVRLFDKGRGAGGRMASRRIDTTLGEAVFDHGAQYFKAREEAFTECVSGWQRDGLVAPWAAAGPAAFVGTPSMNAPLRAMAASLDVTWSARVDAISRDERGWRVTGEGVDADACDAVIVALPAEQAVALLSPVDQHFSGLAAAGISAPCWTVMLAFDAPVAHAADILTNLVEPIGWAARNSAKPGRMGPEAWVVQASPAWSTQHLEDSPAAVVTALQLALAHAVGGALPGVISSTAHRWRYALPAAASREFLWNGSRQIGICGDWLAGPRVDAAWLSGHRLAGAIIG
jgi:predicted NAD/FAD-dependent oxidoreductase